MVNMCGKKEQRNQNFEKMKKFGLLSDTYLKAKKFKFIMFLHFT